MWLCILVKLIRQLETILQNNFGCLKQFYLLGCQYYLKIKTCQSGLMCFHFNQFQSIIV